MSHKYSPWIYFRSFLAGMLVFVIFQVHLLQRHGETDIFQVHSLSWWALSTCCFLVGFVFAALFLRLMSRPRIAH